MTICAYLDVEPVVLVNHHERSRQPARQRPFPTLQLREDTFDNTSAHPISVLEYILDDRPVLVALRYLRVRVALIRIVDAGVDPALKDGEVRTRAHRLRLDEAREEDVRERREVPDVEERLVAEVDRLGV